MVMGPQRRKSLLSNMGSLTCAVESLECSVFVVVVGGALEKSITRMESFVREENGMENQRRCVIETSLVVI